MVSLDDAVIARLRKGNEHFEILVDPYAAADFIEGKDVNILESLAVDAVFEDSKKGEHASVESLQSVFGTTDISEIAKEIILKGDIQLTTEQRHKMQRNKRNRIIEAIVRNAMDPKTKAPHPRQRIELAMEQAGVHIDPFKPVSEQVKTVVEALRPIIPISMEQVRVSVKIPAEFIGKAYGVVRNYGSLEREDWQSDGSWIGIIRIPAGLQTEFYDKLNSATKGNVSTKILK
ncbi:MAG: ribosome assembly factor SBDS [Thermoplasmata archaeon]|nr:MAG: ribosome assembly factor SBDS [Thermoplasmata archaeon]RLF31363.1 MAG: ribosome assembly factor SBDS [Thermoplasmata archaeon]RLF53461.1 MAG: ribosome assembly factor SBDS [Thermoplasmata archaeon]